MEFQRVLSSECRRRGKRKATVLVTNAHKAHKVWSQARWELAEARAKKNALSRLMSSAVRRGGRPDEALCRAFKVLKKSIAELVLVENRHRSEWKGFEERVGNIIHPVVPDKNDSVVFSFCREDREDGGEIIDPVAVMSKLLSSCKYVMTSNLDREVTNSWFSAKSALPKRFATNDLRTLHVCAPSTSRQVALDLVSRYVRVLKSSGLQEGCVTRTCSKRLDLSTSEEYIIRGKFHGASAYVRVAYVRNTTDYVSRRIRCRFGLRGTKQKGLEWQSNEFCHLVYGLIDRKFLDDGAIFSPSVPTDETCEQLDAHFLRVPYRNGFHVTAEDIELYRSFEDAAPRPYFRSLSRWYRNVQSYAVPSATIPAV